MKQLEGRLAVITGASSGLGAGFAEILAEKKCNLVLVARTQSKLIDLQQILSQSNGVTIDALPMDLALPDAPPQLLRILKERGGSADFLINNAGLGSVGPFQKTHWERDEAMIDLNIRALHHLTKLFVEDMLEEGHGRILNVASIAGFQPMPFFASYAATKSYVLNLSEALNQELRGTDVRVSALCPGPTRTEFWEAAGSRGNFIRNFMMMESREVAEYGIKLMLSGRSVGIPGLMNKLMVFGNRFVPRMLAAKIGSAAMKE